MGKGAAIGGGGGAALGAGIGALAGGGKGAAIGAAVGATVGASAGALIGKKMDKQKAELEKIEKCRGRNRNRCQRFASPQSNSSQRYPVCHEQFRTECVCTRVAETVCRIVARQSRYRHNYLRTY